MFDQITQINTPSRMSKSFRFTNFLHIFQDGIFNVEEIGGI